MRLLAFVCLPVFRLEFGGGPKMPKPQPVAANPEADAKAREERANAASAAQAEAMAGGRRQTMVSGIKDEEQSLGGGLSPSRKRASQYLSA
jgi:hypothetical protein